MIRFDDKVAIVTGAGQGLGREHALLLAARGAAVVVNDIEFGPAEEVAKEIANAGGQAVAEGSSVSDPKGAEAIVRAAVESFGGVHVVVNNAGIGGGPFDELVDIHLRGTHNVSMAAWERLYDQGYGRIVNTSSGAGLFGFDSGTGDPRQPYLGYPAAKMGIAGLTRQQALEGAGAGIKVNAIAPVAYSRLTARLPEKAFVDWLRTQFDPSKVAPVVAWLASDECPVTGEVFTVGGGRVARVFIAEARGAVLKDITPEAVAAEVDAIRDQTGYEVFEDASQELATYRRELG